jgi:hypothetical protein
MGLVGADLANLRGLVTQLGGPMQDKLNGVLAAMNSKVQGSGAYWVAADGDRFRADFTNFISSTRNQLETFLQQAAGDTGQNLEAIKGATQDATLVSAMIMPTPGGDGSPFQDSQQAKTAGTKLGQDYQSGKISDQQFLEQLAENEGDPAYAAGAWGQVDTHDTFVKLEKEAEDSGDILPFADSVSSALQAGALKLGSGEPWAWEVADSHTVNPAMVAGLLQDAQFPTKIIVQLGADAIDPQQEVPPVQVFQAMTDDPQAAADFMKQYGPQIEKYCTAKPGDHSWLYETLGDGSGATAFAQMLQAATIPPPGASPQLAAECQKNAENLVKWWSSSDAKGVNTTQPVQAFYGTLVKHYWKDVVFSVTAPHDGAAESGLSPDGMKVNASQWASFIEQAMHNPKTSGDILALGHTQQRAFELEGANIKSDDPDVVDADAWKAGLIGGFVDDTATVTYKELLKENQDANEWAAEAGKQVQEFAGEAADIAVDAVADPGNLAKTAVTGIAKDAFKLFTDNWHPSPDAPTVKAPDLDSWQGTYASDVNTMFNAHANEAFPYSSIRKYAVGDANFTKDLTIKDGKITSGTIIPWDNMTQSQRAAYLRWLEDPAVAKFEHGAGEFNVESEGYLAETQQQERP